MWKKIAIVLAAAVLQPAQAGEFANADDRTMAATYAAREKDWRNGAIVYQVLVDRFAPSAMLEQKRHLYPAPKVLRRWDELPARGTLLPDVKVWSHEIDFWGGDLQSLAGKLHYIRQLGADVLYLNPVHLAYTNHKYDALDYKQVSPEFGTRSDVRDLAAQVHGMGMKLVLDGVFNHMGRNAPVFQEAERNPASRYRRWFHFGQQYPGGARIWRDARNLPELNLGNPEVRAMLYGAPDSVVQGYLRDGVDGWRLDVAYDIGFRYLTELTRAAHKRKPGSLVVGEIANYPKQWFPSVDGVMQFTVRHILLKTAAGELEAKTAAQMLDRIVQDAGIEPMLKSWTYLDNHDTYRLRTVLPSVPQQRLAQALQFTLPGSPNLYYGTELGMTGGDDPEMRAPMRWDLVREDNPHLAYTRQLIALRKSQRALRIGDFRLISTTRLLGFERYTDRAGETVVVLANPSATEVRETVMVANSKLMNDTFMRDLLDPAAKPVAIQSSLLNVTVPPGAVLVLQPQVDPVDGYTPYKHIQ